MFHRNTEKLESLIGANSVFKGNVESKGTLRIDGAVEGNIQADWVIIGEKGLVKGDLSARGIVIGGKVEGNLKAREIVEIKNKGTVLGEICSTKLTVAEGAVFEGRSSMNREEETKVVELISKEKKA